LLCSMFFFDGWRLLLSLRRHLWRPRDKQQLCHPWG
jgi:hypothetical protein